MIAGDTTESADFRNGRYLYCVVAGDSPEFETEGVENEPVYPIEVNGVAAIVHACESLYDTDDFDLVQEWLLDHQAVVDEAGEVFGTPLPFRFDTILKGDDEDVRQWLRNSRDDIRSYLDEFSGYWEYRVKVTRVDEPEFDDDRLDELRADLEAADEGRAFLLEKQHDRRRAELRRALDEEIAADVGERLEPFVREIESSEDAGEVASFSLLAHEDTEGAIGEQLDEIAGREGVEIRFTGPWPPYSFAPEL